MAELLRVTHANNETSLEQFFNSNNIYEIPLYQRRYKWDAPKIRQVIKDFDEILDGEKDVHFFGAIIYYVGLEKIPGKTDSYELIDGQQRITTIFLFICAFVYVLRKYSPEEAQPYFLESLIDLRAKKSNSRLIPGKEDRGQLNWIFNQIVKSSEFKDTLKFDYLAFPSESDSKESGKLKTCYSIFRNYLERKVEECLSKQAKAEKLMQIHKNLLQACTMVSINIQQKENGPMIFDALNSRQETITVGELIKNALFARNRDLSISEMQQIHDTDWLPFVNKFKFGKTSLLEKYLFPYGLIRDIYLKKNNTYKSITSRWEKNKTAQEIVEELTEYQEAYIAINGQKVERYSKKLQECITRIYRASLPASCHPFFMQVLRRVEKEPNFEREAINIFNSIETFLVRRAICNEEPTGLHAVFKKMWSDLDKSVGITSTNVINYIKDPKHKTVAFINDEDFSRGIRETPLCSKNICNFILLEYDKDLSGTEVQEDDNFTIEHVLPRNNSNWTDKFSTDEHEKYIDVFANLVLLTGRSNSSGGNKTFLEKKKLFMSKAKWISTRKFFEDFDDWNPESLRERSRQLAEWALNRWKY